MEDLFHKYNRKTEGIGVERWAAMLGSFYKWPANPDIFHEPENQCMWAGVSL